ncbi:uncharacterized protein LOC134448260 isoform X3 [Engraulis encrasicolus]|uniref:uncharacterized protein LOC134448260 isoform X3 n=1 Tax=Engraulis encrasicolus TaxID=184585 RepID=UPI002FD6F774
MFPRTTDFGTVIVFFTSILSGVHSADVVPALLLALRDSTAAVSSFPTHLNISIRITNRVYNDTLGDPNSPDHKRLRKEVRLLMYYCCCRRPEPTPYMAFNPDIPMYSTQSTIDLPNGKAYDDRDDKARRGMYEVNPATPK